MNRKDRPRKAEKPNKRRFAAGAVALFTSASMMVGGIFHTPADLPDQIQPLPPPILLDEDKLDGDGKNKKSAPTPTPEPESKGESAAASAEPEPALPEEEKKGLRRRWASLSLRQRLWVIPVAALLGWGLFTLFAAFLPGLIGRIVAWLATLAALAAGFVAAEKAVFPELPLRKLLRPRNLAGLLAGLTALGAADVLAPLVWSGYGKWELLIHGAGVVLIFTAAGLSCARRLRREQEAEKAAAAAATEEKPPEPEEEKEKPMTREDILALADSVSRKRK